MSYIKLQLLKNASSELILISNFLMSFPERSYMRIYLRSCKKILSLASLFYMAVHQRPGGCGGRSPLFTYDKHRFCVLCLWHGHDPCLQRCGRYEDTNMVEFYFLLAFGYTACLVACYWSRAWRDRSILCH